MALVVISDTHLTSKFDADKFKKLKDVISGADSIVLNGDFWDGYQTDFDSFIKSPWSELFPLLKSKNAFYVFGNHDKEDFSDERRSSFCTKFGQKYEVTYGGRKLAFEHGDQHVWKLDRVMKIKRPDQWQNNIAEFFQSSMIKAFGLAIFSLLFGRMNNQIKKSMRKNSKIDDGTTYFFGHVHVAEYDKKNNFVNSGIFNYGYAQFVRVEENGNIIPMSEKY